MLVESGKADTALTLCREIASRAPQVRRAAACRCTHPAMCRSAVHHAAMPCCPCRRAGRTAAPGSYWWLASGTRRGWWPSRQRSRRMSATHVGAGGGGQWRRASSSAGAGGTAGRLVPVDMSALDPSPPRPLPTAAWEGLASCYQNLGRFTAALKAYERALELQPDRAYSRIQVGCAWWGWARVGTCSLAAAVAAGAVCHLPPRPPTHASALLCCPRPRRAAPSTWPWAASRRAHSSMKPRCRPRPPTLRRCWARQSAWQRQPARMRGRAPWVSWMGMPGPETWHLGSQRRVLPMLTLLPACPPARRHRCRRTGTSGGLCAPLHRAARHATGGVEAAGRCDGAAPCSGPRASPPHPHTCHGGAGGGRRRAGGAPRGVAAAGGGDAAGAPRVRKGAAPGPGAVPGLAGCRVCFPPRGAGAWWGRHCWAAAVGWGFGAHVLCLCRALCSCCVPTRPWPATAWRPALPAWWLQQSALHAPACAWMGHRQTCGPRWARWQPRCGRGRACVLAGLGHGLPAAPAPIAHTASLLASLLLPCLVQPAVREYALCRALQLDPKCVPAWVALARLYAGEVGGGWVEFVCRFRGLCQGRRSCSRRRAKQRSGTSVGPLRLTDACPPCLQNMARRGRRRWHWSMPAATSPRCRRSGKRWPTWLRSAPQVGGWRGRAARMQGKGLDAHERFLHHALPCPERCRRCPALHRRHRAAQLPGARARPGGGPRWPAGLCRVGHPHGERRGVRPAAALAAYLLSSAGCVAACLLALEHPHTLPIPAHPAPTGPGAGRPRVRFG